MLKKNGIGVVAPNILLPKKGTDYSLWATVACDQYTSQPEYWQETEKIVGNAPSTLRLMLPELYLEKPGEEEKIAAIRAAMQEYLSNGILEDKGSGFVLINRISNGRSRKGLVLALDLENYDYNKGSTTLIRATEGTIVERIPPRQKIREDAPIEMPHILVLIDDPDKTVIEPVFEKLEATKAEKLYDFDLMQNGGHISGYLINDDTTLNSIVDNMEALKKSVDGLPPMLFALGDGNHSFATAKASWEDMKKTLSKEEQENHPARFALVEIENLHDDGIEFEPIHRVIFDVPPRETLITLKEYLERHCEVCEMYLTFDKNELQEHIANYRKYKNIHVLPFMAQGYYGSFVVLNPEAQLEVGSLQVALDAMIDDGKFTKAQIDYVHGDAIVEELSNKNRNLGFLLPPMSKAMLYPTVMREGALPRKTFSMGEAHEKRYYLECKRIL
ncbi:MAG: DUF1015 domain-containing protein [Clostridiales bacterium]|nr:DUF1015 domain-containing protein [Clostridiales bacterium]